MVWRAIGGIISLGDLALFYQAFQQGLRLMRTLLENVGQLYANTLFLGNLFEFLGLEPKVVSPAKPAAGRIAALVGRNGAGKTTLLKLLCRFYDPDSGSITLDGADLRGFSVEDLRRSLTVLFQQPVHYNATAARTSPSATWQAHR